MISIPCFTSEIYAFRQQCTATLSPPFLFFSHSPFFWFHKTFVSFICLFCVWSSIYLFANGSLRVWNRDENARGHLSVQRTKTRQEILTLYKKKMGRKHKTRPTWQRVECGEKVLLRSLFIKCVRRVRHAQWLCKYFSNQLMKF